MNKSVIESLAGALNLDAKVLAKAIASEDEVEFVLPENLKVTTTEKLEELKDNHGKARYDAGKSAGYEMRDKEYRGLVGITETRLTPEELLKTYKEQVLESAEKQPNEALKSAEETIETLRKKLQEKEGEFNAKLGELEVEKRMLSIESAMPDIPESLGISKKEATNLYLSGREFKEDGIYLNGQKLVDDVASPIDVSTDVKQWYETKGWGKTPSGRGGGPKGNSSNVSGKPTTMEEYESLLQEKGIRIGSEQANAILYEAMSDNPNFE